MLVEICETLRARAWNGFSPLLRPDHDSFENFLRNV